MKTRLLKESRELLPPFAGTLLVMVTPFLLWRTSAREMGYVGFGLACVLMAASSFGAEFQHKTFSLLLSQPIPRSRIWREKMLVLGGAILVILMTFGVCLRLFGRPEGFESALIFIPLCAFCATPYFTFVTRSAIAGAVFSIISPLFIFFVAANTLQSIYNEDNVRQVAAAYQVLVALFILYCGTCLWRAYARFQKMQVVDGAPGEPGLPASLEAVLAVPLAKIGSHFTGPLASLVKKELRLQQISFLVAGFCGLACITAAGFGNSKSETAIGVFGAAYSVMVLVVPLMVGALAVTEERSLGIADWHLTLPPSTRKQWSAKIMVTFLTSLLLGLLLPGLLFLAGQAAFSTSDEKDLGLSLNVILPFVLGNLALTSAALYTGSLSTNTLRAILAALALALGAVCMVPIAAWLLHDFRVSALPTLKLMLRLPGSGVPAWVIASIGLPVFAGLLHQLAFLNFRERMVSKWMTAFQVATILFLALLFASALVTFTH